MIEVEYIFPYTIVKENDLYGIVDRTGNLVVPCVMDEIVNDKNEEIGLSTWNDYSCVIIVKDGKYGFFTDNGKFIEPAYENYAIDPCVGNIHVETIDGYGVLSPPNYLFKEVPYSSSLFSEFDDIEDNALCDAYNESN